MSEERIQHTPIPEEEKFTTVFRSLTMKNWIKKILGITALEEENRRLNAQVHENTVFVSEKIAELKAYTRVDADVGVRGNNTIILTGVYKRQAYVRFYDLGDGEFEGLINQLRSMKDHALIRHVDQPPALKAMFDL